MDIKKLAGTILDFQLHGGSQQTNNLPETFRWHLVESFPQSARELTEDRKDNWESGHLADTDEDQRGDRQYLKDIARYSKAPDVAAALDKVQMGSEITAKDKLALKSGYRLLQGMIDHEQNEIASVKKHLPEEEWIDLPFVKDCQENLNDYKALMNYYSQLMRELKITLPSEYKGR